MFLRCDRYLEVVSAVVQYAARSEGNSERRIARLAVATCEELPHLDQDGPALLSALEDRGIQAEVASWDDPEVDWSAYELVVIRSTWNYAARHGAFVTWADALPRVLNPAQIIRWNTDKRYLADLAAAGVPTVDTLFIASGDVADPQAWRAPDDWPECVIKPTVSAGSADTARWRRGTDDVAAAAHLGELLAAGRTAMVQPYLSAVDSSGESALIYVGGRFSHSVRKAPILTAGTAPTPLAMDDHDPREQISAREATPADLAIAERVLAAVPGGVEQLLYARVDLLLGADGAPVLLELELTEPSLFFGTAPGSVERFADAVVTALG